MGNVDERCHPEVMSSVASQLLGVSPRAHSTMMDWTASEWGWGGVWAELVFSSSSNLAESNRSFASVLGELDW